MNGCENHFVQVAGLKMYSPPSITVALIKPPSRAKRSRVSKSRGRKKAKQKRQYKAIRRKNAQSGRESKPKPRKKTMCDRGSTRFPPLAGPLQKKRGGPLRTLKKWPFFVPPPNFRGEPKKVGHTHSTKCHVLAVFFFPMNIKSEREPHFWANVHGHVLRSWAHFGRSSRISGCVHVRVFSRFSGYF